MKYNKVYFLTCNGVGSVAFAKRVNAGEGSFWIVERRRRSGTVTETQFVLCKKSKITNEVIYKYKLILVKF